MVVYNQALINSLYEELGVKLTIAEGENIGARTRIGGVCAISGCGEPFEKSLTTLIANKVAKKT